MYNWYFGDILPQSDYVHDWITQSIHMAKCSDINVIVNKVNTSSLQNTKYWFQEGRGQFLSISLSCQRWISKQNIKQWIYIRIFVTCYTKEI